VLRRLLQRLQQRVEAAGGEHVHLVDQIHLEAAAHRREGDVVQQLAGLVHLGPRRRIHLDQVDEPALVDLLAGGTDAAGVAPTPCSQFRVLARMRARVVLPTPRVPVNR
jgi:hypothetical protein